MSAASNLIYKVVQVLYFLVSALIVLSIIESGLLNHSTIIVELYISPFNSVGFCFRHFKILLLNTDMLIIIIFS
jgi:hypothetical protein